MLIIKIYRNEFSNYCQKNGILSNNKKTDNIIRKY